MRFRWRCGALATSLLCLLLLVFAGCSSQQDQQEDLQSEQGEEGATPPEGAQAAEGADNFAGNIEGGLEGGNNELLGANNVAAGEGNGTGDNDLANIINEMNQQGQPAPAANAAAAAPPVPAPVAPTGGGVVTGTSGVAAGPGLPEMGSKLAYIVKPGDTLAKIAARIFGNPMRYQELAQLSNIPDPSRIFPGDVIYYQLNNESLAFATDYENVARQEVQAQSGDTLAAIASRVYGDSKHWAHIWRQNGHIIDPDNLTAGTPVYYVSMDVLAKTKEKSTKTPNLAQENTVQEKDGVDGKNITVEIMDHDFELSSYENLALDFSAELIDV